MNRPGSEVTPSHSGYEPAGWHTVLCQHRQSRVWQAAPQ